MYQADLFNLIYNKSIKEKNLPLIVGISGIDYAGKTLFTKDFSKYLNKLGINTSIIHIDDFYNGKELNYKGSKMPLYYFKNSYDIKRILEELIRPFKRDSSIKKRIALWNEENNKYDIYKNYFFRNQDVILVEGVYLFQKCICPFLDYKISLIIQNSIAESRARKRDIKRLSSHEALIEYKEKFLPAYRAYLTEENPIEHIDISILNDNWKNPIIIKKNDRLLTI